uniref:Uncharacterized protein n=1 Tax=Arundo donax TaxID=35708 RepID=A0A0A8ZX21_ARUDO
MCADKLKPLIISVGCGFQSNLLLNVLIIGGIHVRIAAVIGVGEILIHAVEHLVKRLTHPLPDLLPVGEELVVHLDDAMLLKLLANPVLEGEELLLQGRRRLGRPAHGLSDPVDHFLRVELQQPLLVIVGFDAVRFLGQDPQDLILRKLRQPLPPGRSHFAITTGGDHRIGRLLVLQADGRRRFHLPFGGAPLHRALLTDHHILQQAPLDTKSTAHPAILTDRRRPKRAPPERTTHTGHQKMRPATRLRALAG